MTNNTNIEGLPPLPDGYDGYRYGVPEAGDMRHLHGLWRLAEGGHVCEYLIATLAPLWYPKSWRDDMENVFEVKAGEWPPCAPGDVIDTLLKGERLQEQFLSDAKRSTTFDWGGGIVAIRIIERARP